LPNIRPFVPTTFTRRKTGYYLETTAVNFLPVAVINIVYSLHNLLFLLLLFFFFFFFFSLGRLINISPQVQSDFGIQT